MIDRPTQRLGAILEREVVESRWETHRWKLLTVVPDPGGEVRDVIVDERRLHRIHPSIEVALFRDEAEGYYLNVSSGEPSVFISLRIDEASGEPRPFEATLSYNEAARWMDASERVERVAVWPELAEWIGTWVEANYRPEPKKRRRPRSFEEKGARMQERSKS